jgi:hypothetical protein
VATPSTIRVELVWRFNALDWAVNVLHYTTGVSGPLIGDDVSALASSIGTAFTGSGLRPFYDNLVTLDRIQARDIRTDGNEVLTSTINLAGTSAGETMPLQTCVVTTLRTTFVTRRGRGRIYWPATSVTSTNGFGAVAPALVTAFGAFTQDLMLVAAGSQGNLALGVLSRVDNTTRTVVTNSTNNTYDVQTRRRDLSIS